MADRRSTGTIPANSLLTDFKNIKFILSSTSGNNHGSDITTVTLAPGQIQLAQINKNNAKIQQAIGSTTTAAQSIVRTIAPAKIAALPRGTNLTTATVLQPAVVQQQHPQHQLATTKINLQQQSSSPSKIIIQALNFNPVIQKVVKPPMQKSFSTVSFGSNNNNNTNNNSIGNSIVSSNNNTASNSNSTTQVFRFIGGQQAQVAPMVKQTHGTLANKSKSLSIVNPSQVSKVTQQPITSQRLILPATTQVQVAMAANPALFQGVATPTSVSYLATPGNHAQGFAFVQTPTVITPSNQHSAPSDCSGGSSENNSTLKIHSLSSNENLTGTSSRQTQSQLHQQQQLHQQWMLSETITNVRQRKPCNCTKSQCLKLYCECFANGEFCKDCNCCNCANNLQHEEERTRAIKSCMERNPHAFHPKIGKGGSNRHHNKGCNCKRSGCLKNYCECYEAKILCSNLCRCIGCRNYEESIDRQKLMQLADAAEVRVQQQTAAENKLSMQILGTPLKPQAMALNGQRPPYTFVTLDVIEAVSSCLIAEGDDNQLSEAMQERQILEEFGRCLSQVIDMASKTRASSP